MGLLARLLGTDLKATADPTSDFWYQPVGVSTTAGMRIDSDTAKRISAWYRGRDILATVLAMLPLAILERLPNEGGAKQARSHPLWDVLHDKPNGWQDSFQWRRMSMYHLIDYGNSYHRIIDGPRGFAHELRPIDPRLVTPALSALGEKRYLIRNATTGLAEELSGDYVFHLRGASDDGIVGRGILEHARNSLGTAAATESYAGSVFSRGSLSGGVITTPGLLNDKASERMARSFSTPTGDWHLPKVLEQGATWVPNALTPEDAQMLLSRKHTVDDIARWLGVPRQMLENNDPSFGNAEQFDRSFIAYSLGPWLSLFEFAIGDQLIEADKKYYAQFTREALVRGDLAARWQAHVSAVNAGIKTVDEVRAVENLNTRGGKADELREPQNIVGKPRAVVPDVEDEDEPEPPEPKKTPEPIEEDSAQARAIVTASASRLLRKEVAAVQKAAVRHAANEDAFCEAVTEFYSHHVALVTLTLQMAAGDAEAYCANQARQVVGGPWVDALALWQTPDYAAGVAAIALEEGSYAV